LENPLDLFNFEFPSKKQKVFFLKQVWLEKMKSEQKIAGPERDRNATKKRNSTQKKSKKNQKNFVSKKLFSEQIKYIFCRFWGCQGGLS
jgi:hypothetical protein